MIESSNMTLDINRFHKTGIEKRMQSSIDKEPGKAGNSEFKKHLENAVQKGEGKSSKVIDKRLMDVCIDMESLFVARMYKEMRKTIHKTKWIHGGHAEEIFEDMLYDKYALNVSKNSNLGLAKQLYEEMSRKR